MTAGTLGGAGFAFDAGSGSGQTGITGGTGLNNIALLVKTWGRVTEIDPDKRFFYIEDGSALKDGTSTLGIEHRGLRVERHPLDLKPGDRLTLTGISSCFFPEWRDVRRVLRACDLRAHFPAAPSFVLGVPDIQPGSCRIIFTAVDGATGYELYLSTNGVNYSVSTTLPVMIDGYGYFALGLNANTYCRVRAIAANDTYGGYSEAVYARVMSPQGHFRLYEPHSEYAESRTPTIHWDYAPGAARMGIEIREKPTAQADGRIAWGAIALSWNYRIAYGQTANCLTYAPATDTLLPDTAYVANVYAIDSANWAFASCGAVPFTTVSDDAGE